MFGALLKAPGTVVSAGCAVILDNEAVQVEDNTCLKSSTVGVELPPKPSLLSVKLLLIKVYILYRCV